MGQAGARSGGQGRAPLGLLLVLATLLAFSPLPWNGFVNLDDPQLITANAHVREGLTARGAWWALTSTAHANWHPLTWLAHQTVVQLFGLRPWAHHLASLLLHTAAALLLYRTLRRLTGAAAASLFAAGLFALHPLRVESVAWAAELKDPLSAVCFMLALGAYRRWCAARRPRDYGALLLWFALGLAAKPMLVTLPVVLLVLDLWPLGRAGVPRRRGPSPGPGTAALLLEKAPLFLLAGAVGLLTIATQREVGAVGSLARYPFAIRAMNAATATAAYLGKTIVPGGLSVFYPHPGADIPPARVLAASLLLALVTVLALRRFRSQPGILAGWLWYLTMLAPVSGLAQTGFQGMADRFTYLPLVGVGIAAGWGLPPLARALRLPARAPLVAGACFLAAVAALTAAQTRLWRDTRTLFSHALSLDPSNWLAHVKLGEAARAAGRPAEAIAHLERAVAGAPWSIYARTLLGTGLGESGRTAEAVAVLREAVRRGPDYADARHALAVALVAAGRALEAVPHLVAEARIAPRSPRPRRQLAYLAAEAGDFAAAETWCREWLALEPEAEPAHALLARIAAARRAGR